MPTNEILESGSGAKEALRLLKLSKERNSSTNVDEQYHSSLNKNKKSISLPRKNNNCQRKRSISSNELYNDSVKLLNVSSASSKNRKLTRNNSNLMQEAFEDDDDNKCLNIEPFVVKVIGTDQAEYTLEIFMRDVISCLTKRDLARKTDARAPIAYCYCRCGSKGVRNQAHAIIPTNQKLMLYAKRTAKYERHRVGQRKFVLFKFYVDGTALSEGQLYETSLSNPDVHWAKTHITTTNTVEDEQCMENIQDANQSLGMFKIEIWTKLKDSKVVEEYKAIPEDNRCHEKRKQKICIASSDEGGVETTTFEKEVGGLKGYGPPQAVINVCYDNLLGTRLRHFGSREFALDKLKRLGVTDAMIIQAYPNPVKKEAETIEISDDSEEIDENLIANMVDEDIEVKRLGAQDKGGLSPSKQDTEIKPKKDEEIDDESLSFDSTLQENTRTSLKSNSSLYCWPSELDQLVDDSTKNGNDVFEDARYDKINIRLRTACGEITELSVLQSFTVQKVINIFLDNRKVNTSCDRKCCPTGLAYDEVRLSFECDILQEDKTIHMSDIQCGDLIDILVINKVV